MKRFNVSEGKDSYSQRNNVLRGIRACNVTSMIMCLSYEKDIIFPKGEYKQDEDNLLNFILTDSRVDAFYKKVDPINYKKYISCGKDPEISFPPNEMHRVLAYGTNLWLNKDNFIVYSDNVSLQRIFYSLVKGHAVVQSGLFGTLHHVVCTVGFNTEQDIDEINIKESDIDLKKISSIIIDDPYGDYRTGYKIQKGNDIEIPYEEYLKIMKPQDNLGFKRAHTLSSLL